MPCSNNGRIPDADLHDIPGGRLKKDAAAAWLAPNGPADNGLLPSGPELSSYRDLAGQQKTWAIYQAGGNLAAYPGTSEHGCGKAVDLAAEWMRSWVDDHGARFGWRKTEAFSEWWHVNFVGGVSFKLFEALVFGRKNKRKRVRFYARRLAYIQRRSIKAAYLPKATSRYTHAVKGAVNDFQQDHGLQADGVIGEATAHAISAAFHKQYVARHGRRKRKLKDKLRRRP